VTGRAAATLLRLALSRQPLTCRCRPLAERCASSWSHTMHIICAGPPVGGCPPAAVSSKLRLERQHEDRRPLILHTVCMAPLKTRLTSQCPPHGRSCSHPGAQSCTRLSLAQRTACMALLKVTDCLWSLAQHAACMALLKVTDCLWSLAQRAACMALLKVTDCLWSLAQRAACEALVLRVAG
jgi:hypothetical protein